MIKKLLVPEHDVSLKSESWRAFKIAIGAFVAISIIGFISYSGDRDAVLVTLAINVIMSFSITYPATFVGSCYINQFTRKLSLTVRSVLSFLFMVIAISAGIFLGQFLVWLFGIIDDPYFIGRKSFAFIFIFSCIVGAISTTYYGLKELLEKAYERIRTQERQKSELEILKTKAELEALQAKINPHFLFNSLNSISGLISLDPEKAEEMTLKLAELFRSTLKFKDDSFCSLEEEIHLIKTYLDIEKIRFGNRLNYKITVNEKLGRIRIPQLLIQPIVENALKHGIEKITGEGMIIVAIERDHDNCVISVKDNGPGINSKVSFGYGLSNIQKRLEYIYKDNFKLEIKSDGGTEVGIRIPEKILN